MNIVVTGFAVLLSKKNIGLFCKNKMPMFYRAHDDAKMGKVPADWISEQTITRFIFH